MHVYCTEVLHLSDAEAYSRITVARAFRRHPMLLEVLADGRIHLTGLVRLAPHLTLENRDELLKRATHRLKREIEELVAELLSRPDVPSAIRKPPARSAPQLLQHAGDPGTEHHQGSRPVDRGLVPERAHPEPAPASQLVPERLLAEREYGKEWMNQFRRQETGGAGSMAEEHPARQGAIREGTRTPQVDDSSRRVSRI